MTTRLLTLLACSLLTPIASAQIVSESAAQRAGLDRAWFALATEDAPTRGVVGAVVEDGTVYVLGGSGVLTAYDAEAGFARWSTRCGRPDLPAQGPSVHKLVDSNGEPRGTRVGVISGSDLHVLDADSGEFVLSRALAGPAAGPPAITSTHAYIPQLRGVMIGYPFDTLRGLQRRVASPGSLLAAPTLASERVIWTTDRGELYGAVAATGRAVYRFDTEAPVVGSPSAVEDMVCFANREGIVFGIGADRGRVQWRTALGVSIDQAAVAVDDLVLVADQTPTLHALDAKTGAERWRVEGLSHFVAASANRVYALNSEGALGVLDRETGEPVASWRSVGALRPVVNTETDRLFLISESGILQCFHESGAETPYRHDGVVATPPIPEEVPADQPADQPETSESADTPADDEDPFGDGADPFGEDEPADTPADDEDPFGGDEDPFADGEDPFGF